MRETAKVVRLENGKGVVQLDSRGGCKNCGMNGVCHSTGSGVREMTLHLEGQTVKEGDIVEIETPARSLVTAAFLVFILPLIIASSAYFVVQHITGDQGYGLLGFFLCFVLAEFLIAWVDKKFGQGRFFQPRIVKRIPGSS